MLQALLLLLTSCFCSGCSEVAFFAVEYFGLFFFCIFSPEFVPTTHACDYFLVSYNFFVIFAQGQGCIEVHAQQIPDMSQPVPPIPMKAEY